MTWLISKNPIKLALVALLWNLVIGVAISIIQLLLKFDSASAIAGFAAIYIVGSGYTLKYHEVMDKDLRHQVSGIFSLIQYVLAFVFYFLTPLQIPLMAWFIIITIVTVLLYFIMRWLLKFAGDQTLKRLKPKKHVKS